ncbi:MAG: amino acid permease [Acidimicrobiia bacterium]
MQDASLPLSRSVRVRARLQRQGRVGSLSTGAPMSHLKPSDEPSERGSRAPDRPFEEPGPLSVDSSILPEPGWRHRFKFRLLGRPLHSEALEHETLGKPTALAVFASDNLSSAAYATEQILVQLVPVVGAAAFALLVPTTAALLVVLGFLILSYRQTIEAYPKAASAYLVTKDNFGLRPALLAAVALLTAYVLTVAVSVAAGSAALASAFPRLTSYRVPIAIAFIALVAYGNLRGVRESGRVFAVPTYFFLVNMGILLVWGVVRLIAGHLPVASLDHKGLVPIGQAGSGLLQGASLFVVLRAFASGGAAVTGVEAISDGVPAFRPPAWKNARSTLVIMGVLLSVMFIGISILADHMQVIPYRHGTPTVLAQIGRLVYGSGLLGHVMYFGLQAATVFILVLAANTSYADFPRLANFAAADNFMPRQLMIRGHRLVFSNGILVLSGAAIVLVLATDAVVERLIPLYAIGVFTSFTLSQASMARRHFTGRQPGWRRNLLINGTGALLTLVVDVVIAVTKFTSGAWAILVAIPILVALLLRLNRQYVAEGTELAADASRVATAPILRRHVVLVFIDRLDAAAARAIQYSRTLVPNELRAVHFIIDAQRAEELAGTWRRLGLAGIPLELRECSDRVIPRAAIQVVAEALADGETEVSVLMPDRKYRGVWHRILHDRTANKISEEVSRLPHANVTLVPFHLGTQPPAPKIVKFPVSDRRGLQGPESGPVYADGSDHLLTREDGTTRIGHVRFRTRARVRGKIRAQRVQPLAGVPTLECVISDETGRVSVVFFGRRQIPGIAVGRTLIVEGMLAEHRGRLCFLNPLYELMAD